MTPNLEQTFEHELLNSMIVSKPAFHHPQTKAVFNFVGNLLKGDKQNVDLDQFKPIIKTRKDTKTGFEYKVFAWNVWDTAIRLINGIVAYQSFRSTKQSTQTYSNRWDKSAEPWDQLEVGFAGARIFCSRALVEFIPAHSQFKVRVMLTDERILVNCATFDQNMLDRSQYPVDELKALMETAWRQTLHEAANFC